MSSILRKSLRKCLPDAVRGTRNDGHFVLVRFCHGSALFSLDAKLVNELLPIGTIRIQQLAELGGTED
jgi:hypothetical protein